MADDVWSVNQSYNWDIIIETTDGEFPTYPPDVYILSGNSYKYESTIYAVGTNVSVNT